MKKKWLALFLCVSMPASLFGCQSKAPVESEQTVTEETPDAAETAEENEIEESTEKEEPKEEEELASLLGFNMVEDGDFSEGKEK